MKTVLVTGASGFIGKNLCAYLKTLNDVEVLSFNRYSTDDDLQTYIEQADFIFHLAGVNRPQNESDFSIDNTELTEQILALVKAVGKKTPLLLASSSQAEQDNPYGRSKLAAENAVIDWHSDTGFPVHIYRLPGVFGKWCKPNYNSVVATFCHNIANGLPIEISDSDYMITLAYVDDVVREFVERLNHPTEVSKDFYRHIPTTFEVSLGELSKRIYALHESRTNLVVPDLGDALNRNLLATYTSYLTVDNFSYNLDKKIDDRGWLAEFIKSNQFGQIFISKTKPGISRGDHWHNTKVEKFLVIEGIGEILFRHYANDKDVTRYKVTGEDLTVVDIPVGYVHAIVNVGETDMLTLFWASEVLDRENPDTIYEKVSAGGHHA